MPAGAAGCRCLSGAVPPRPRRKAGLLPPGAGGLSESCVEAPVGARDAPRCFEPGVPNGAVLCRLRAREPHVFAAGCRESGSELQTYPEIACLSLAARP